MLIIKGKLFISLEQIHASSCSANCLWRCWECERLWSNERLLPNPESNVSHSKHISLFLDQRCSSVGLLVEYSLEWVTSWSSCQVLFPTDTKTPARTKIGKLASETKAFTPWGCRALRPVRIGSQYHHDEDYKEDAQCELRVFLTHKVPLEGRYAHWRCSTLQAKALCSLAF